ncbi:MAG: hypothetical protein IJU37_12725 [Desulfovibrio sp.]|nr:hypothetical protein [Desulfovibrio sp.]
MKKVLATLVAAAFLCAPAMSLAGDETDMAKLPCKEFIKAPENEMGILLGWIDGYMSAKSDNTMMSQAWMEKLGKHMGEFCAKNPDKTIMQAMEAMPE